jgi:hypothetical protein
MRISYTKRQTKNLGNYENVSFEITVEDDVDFSKETQDEVFERLSLYVNNKLTEQLTIKEVVNVDLVKAKILQLIDHNPNYRIEIKNRLIELNAEKVADLSDVKLQEFYKFLLRMNRTPIINT